MAASNYFGEQIEKGQPIVPPTPKPEPDKPVTPPMPGAPAGPTLEVKEEWQGLPVRAGGDRIFLLKGGKKYWVQNAEAYQKLGFKFGDECKIDQATLDALEDGDIIT